MNEVFITAEIGINANGSLETAKQLIDMAKLCGCDAVKFQKRTVETVYTKEFLDSPRQSPWGTTQREQKMALEFTVEQYAQINAYCYQTGIEWYASAWDIESLEFLKQYNLKYNKIASPMVLNQAFVLKVAEMGKQTYISTGKATKADLDMAVLVFQTYKTPFTLMHCVNKYPCFDDDCSLKKITWLKKQYNVPVGYSNHHPSILPCSLAVSLGAEAVETHITLDRTSYGTDMPASMEFSSLYYVVRDANRVRGLIG